MNFLAHMLLSGADDQILVGNFMGDFVKGPLEGRFPPRIRFGVALHRRIDGFAGTSPLFRQSRLRLSEHYGLFRGVLVDLFYDHFLAAGWDEWSDEPFPDFLHRTRRVVERHRPSLPERLPALVPVIFEELLPSYGRVEGIAAALARMSRRVRRPNPLAGGEAELLLQYDGLRQDFRDFMPLARSFARAAVAAYQAENGGAG